jgi:predicted RNase H-like HicB family nuclease
MLAEYMDEALSRARYELIDDPDEPYYGEVSDLPGVWASGTSLESCRAQPKDVIEGWILLSIKNSLPNRAFAKRRSKEIEAEVASWS